MLEMRRFQSTISVQRKPISRRFDVVFSICLASFVLLFGLALIVKHRANPPQRCPIDGQLAEWRNEGYRDHNICNYGHFSKVDQKPHSWWASCI
jgi:hypothetical protein